jgi:hypothetical protein
VCRWRDLKNSSNSKQLQTFERVWLRAFPKPTGELCASTLPRKLIKFRRQRTRPVVSNEYFHFSVVRVLSIASHFKRDRLRPNTDFHYPIPAFSLTGILFVDRFQSIQL